MVVTLSLLNCDVFSATFRDLSNGNVEKAPIYPSLVLSRSEWKKMGQPLKIEVTLEETF